LIRYVDTSVFIPLFLPESTSVAIRSWFQRSRLDEVAISSWTLTEFASALGRKVRSRAASADSAAVALAGFRGLARESLSTVVPRHRDFVDATALIERSDLGLRAGDALHVAIARNHGATSFVTLDKRLGTAAERLGLPCEAPA
jgi:uncharacterized protein